MVHHIQSQTPPFVYPSPGYTRPRPLPRLSNMAESDEQGVGEQCLVSSKTVRGQLSVYSVTLRL